MFPHVDVQIVLPFSDVSAFGAHEVLVVRVSEHVLREVGLISASEVTQATLVGLLTCSRERDLKSGKTPNVRASESSMYSLLTTVHQLVALQASFMRGHVAALRAAVDLLVGVQMTDVALELHGVERGEGAKVTAELVAARVTVPLVPEEDGLVGTRELALGAVVGEVRPMVSLHVRLASEDGAAGVMATLRRLDPVRLGRVPQQFFAQGAPEGAALLEAGGRLAARRDVVRLHVGLQRPALAEAFAAGGAGVAAARRRAVLVGVHAGEVSADGVALHGGVLAQVAAVELVAGLAEAVHAQLALAGEVALAVGTLEAGVGEV